MTLTCACGCGQAVHHTLDDAPIVADGGVCATVACADRIYAGLPTEEAAAYRDDGWGAIVPLAA